MKRFPCEEVTIEITVDGFKVRLWYNAETFDPGLRTLTVDPYSVSTAKELATQIATRVVGLNAVQVIDKNTSVGYMIYTVPFEDKDESPISSE